ncbi:MAG TPA: LptF/LptG family permease [Verrucomicrobiae bacterium]
MRLHDRYLFRELLTPLACCLGGFLVFWISFFFFSETEHIREAKLHFLDTVEYAAAKTPEFFVLVLPFTLLLALLYALTHHARHNEITALRSAGVGLWRLCAPYFAVGLIATGIYFALNEIVVPQSAQWSEEILNRYNQKTTDGKTKTRFTDVNFRSVHANRVYIWHMDQYDAVSATMTGPKVTWTLPDGSWRVLQAERAVRTNGVWIFFNAQHFEQSGLRGNLVQTSFFTNEIAPPEFDETPKQILLAIKFSDAEGLLASRSADIPLSELWPYLRQNPDLSSKKAGRMLTKFHERIAAPWTCFIVVLVAIPFGAQSGRRNLFFGVAGSIFICFSYFVLQQVSFAFGMSGHLPGWLAAWLPNFIFAALGIVLMLRTR